METNRFKRLQEELEALNFSLTQKTGKANVSKINLRKDMILKQMKRIGKKHNIITISGIILPTKVGFTILLTDITPQEAHSYMEIMQSEMKAGYSIKYKIDTLEPGKVYESGKFEAQA